MMRWRCVRRSYLSPGFPGVLFSSGFPGEHRNGLNKLLAVLVTFFPRVLWPLFTESIKFAQLFSKGLPWLTNNKQLLTQLQEIKEIIRNCGSWERNSDLLKLWKEENYSLGRRNRYAAHRSKISLGFTTEIDYVFWGNRPSWSEEMAWWQSSGVK